MTERPIGLTRDAGWQIGVSRTFPVDLEAAWEQLTSEAGIKLWLGGGVASPLTKGAHYQTRDGTTGEVRSVRPLDRLRLTWQPAGRDAPATVQLTVVESSSGCSVRFHAERLASEQEREHMRSHWRTVLDRLAGALD